MQSAPTIRGKQREQFYLRFALWEDTSYFHACFVTLRSHLAIGKYTHTYLDLGWVYGTLDLYWGVLFMLTFRALAKVL